MPASGRAAPPSAGGILLLLLTAGGVAAALAVGPSRLTGRPFASADFPPDFGDRAYTHVVSIVGASRGRLPRQGAQGRRLRPGPVAEDGTEGRRGGVRVRIL